MYVLCDIRFAPIPINDYSNGRLMGFDSIYNVYVALSHQKWVVVCANFLYYILPVGGINLS